MLVLHRQPQQLLKWIGNKQRFAKYIIGTMPDEMNTYIEPFIGTGAVLGYLRPKKAIVGDTLKPLIDLWELVKHDPDLVSKFYEKKYYSYMKDRNSVYELTKASYNSNPNALDMLFISRTCYGGVMRFTREGTISTPIGPHKPIPPVSFTKRAFEWSEIVSNTKFYNQSFEKTMSYAKKGDVVYCDPPYLYAQSILYGSQSFKVEKQLYNNTATLTPNVDFADYAVYNPPGNGSTAGEWHFEMRIGNIMTSREMFFGQNVPCPNIYSHDIEVDNESGIGYDYGPYVDGGFAPADGAYPATGGENASQANYGPEVGTLLEAAIEKLYEDMPGENLIFTGFDLAEELMQCDPAQISDSPPDPRYFKVSWTYQSLPPGTDTSNASNYIYWDQWAAPSQQTQINVTSSMSVIYSIPIGDTPLTFPLSETIPITIIAPPPDPRLMNGQQLSQYGIDSIPTSEYSESSLAISNGSPTDASNIKNKGNNYIYRISNNNLSRYIKIGSGRLTYNAK